MQFKDFPFKADVLSVGPSIIKRGKIQFNGVTVHEGYRQYHLWKNDMKQRLPVATDVVLEGIECSSGEIVNQLFKDVGNLINT